jgi:hypothetical protein
MNMKHGVAQLVAFTALGVVMQFSRADDYISPTDERVRISLGAMHVSSATTLQSDSSAGVAGSVIDGEGQFGLDRSNFEPKFQAMFRVDTRQRLSLDYFTLDRSGDATVRGEPLVFRNVLFLPGDPLQTQLNVRTLGLTYGYSFWHSETLELGATLGVHATDISTEAKVETQDRHIIQTQDEAGPVPTVGIDATWVASKRFYVDGRAQYLNVHVRDVSGSLGIYELDGLYRYRANVAFAVGYTDIQAHLASTKASQGGLFDIAARGPVMFFRISF